MYGYSHHLCIHTYSSVEPHTDHLLKYSVQTGLLHNSYVDIRTYLVFNPITVLTIYYTYKVYLEIHKPIPIFNCLDSAATVYVL